ncbi:MAG TPA: hypothetical protein VE175_11935 [Woeseiaceae bacterium]|nr:hypothetical protein [Woeseiaceae bacterium]
MTPSSAAAQDRTVARSKRAKADAAALHRLVTGFSIEATPKQLAGTDSLPGVLPAGTRIYVPWLPRARVEDAVSVCRELVAQGFCPVPHLAARAIGSRARLEARLGDFSDAGARALLLIAGDRRRAAGPFASTQDVLDTGLLCRYGFDELGVAGHPEGHPVADEGALIRALRMKQGYTRDTGSTVWIVTQFAFAAAPVMAWLDRLRDEGIELPVRIGLPGPARPGTLLRYALQCGVGSSSRLLAKRPDAVTRMLARWTPAGMLPALARHAARNEKAAVAGIHVFPFGGLWKSIEFFTRLQAGSAEAGRTHLHSISFGSPERDL